MRHFKIYFIKNLSYWGMVPSCPTFEQSITNYWEISLHKLVNQCHIVNRLAWTALLIFVKKYLPNDWVTFITGKCYSLTKYHFLRQTFSNNRWQIKNNTKAKISLKKINRGRDKIVIAPLNNCGVITRTT